MCSWSISIFHKLRERETGWGGRAGKKEKPERRERESERDGRERETTVEKAREVDRRERGREGDGRLATRNGLADWRWLSCLC